MAGKPMNLIGQKFGRLTPIKMTSERQNNSVVWECECECGNICKANAASLRAGRTKSCGCLKQESDKAPKGNVIDLTGQKFNHLTVLKRDGSDNRGEAKWLCECDCEQHSKISVLSSNLRNGHTTSCGCERMSHGEQKIAKLLLENNIPFEREVSLFRFANNKPAYFDFFIDKKYLIEYDGETHYRYNLHGWHNEEQLKAQQERNMIKTQWCKEHNIPLIRIPYTKYETLCIEDLLLRESAEVTLD